MSFEREDAAVAERKVEFGINCTTEALRARREETAEG